MKDKFGNPLMMAWPEYQVLWIEAAMSLPRVERGEAYLDIAQLSGRTVFAVIDKAHWIKFNKRDLARREANRTRLIMVASGSRPVAVGPG